MARKASDLLDVFRLRPESPADRAATERASGGRPSKKDKKPKRKKTARAKRAADVVVSLSRRQSVYAGCVVVLLLALSFTLGVSLAGDDAPGEPSLRRDTEQPWYIVGELPLNSMLADKRVDIQEAAARLRGRFGVPRSKLNLSRKGDTFRIWIGPFPSKDAAFHFHEQYQLDGFNFAGLAPFMAGGFTQDAPPSDG